MAPRSSLPALGRKKHQNVGLLEERRHVRRADEASLASDLAPLGALPRLGTATARSRAATCDVQRATGPAAGGLVGPVLCGGYQPFGVVLKGKGIPTIWGSYNISPTRHKVVGSYSRHKPPFGVRSCEVVMIHPEPFGVG